MLWPNPQSLIGWRDVILIHGHLEDTEMVIWDRLNHLVTSFILRPFPGSLLRLQRRPVGVERSRHLCRQLPRQEAPGAGQFGRHRQEDIRGYMSRHRGRQPHVNR